MNLRFRSKLLALFLFLIILFASVQGYLLYFSKTSWILASFIGVLISGFIAFFFLRVLIRPIRRITELAFQFTPESKTEKVFPDDELVNLSKAIREMGNQLQKKIVEISQEKEYLQAVLRGMIEGVLVVDEKGRIRMINEALQDLFALPSDVADKFPLEVIRNAQLESTIREVVQEGRNLAFEMDVPGVDKKIFEVNIVPILGGPVAGSVDRKVSGAIAVFHDITRLKELEKIRQDFVANVSHELRTPLTTIKGYVETLLEGALKEEVAPQFLQIINRHTDRLTKIVEDLLALSRIESREFRLQLEGISLAELIDDALDFVKGAADRNKISISRADLPGPILIQGDRNHLEQVLTNLLDNAIKYGHEGGRVTVSAIETDQKEVRIAVQDDGMGIPKEDLHRIFERFYRVDKGRSKELGGTGLGLSIVKHIVQAHGGRVWATSEPGKGSTFHCTLPIKSETH